MKQFFTFVSKEFAHVFRDRKSLLMLFGLPIAQILLFGFALSNEVRNARIAIMNGAGDVATQSISDRLSASAYFEVVDIPRSIEHIDALFRRGDVQIAVVFAPDFYNNLRHLGKAQVQIIADASDPNAATTLSNYATAIINDYNAELLEREKIPYQIIPQVRMLYNPQLKGAPNFVPGVMALVLMLVCVMMTSISIVREKELGTMEILLVSPFRPVLVLLAKTVPYLLISLMNLTMILLLSVYLLDMPVNGSIILLVAESTLFIVTSLSLGLLISTRTASQQTAMLLSLMGMLLPTMLFTGFMFPIENMPLPLRIISYAVPARWYYSIVKAVMIKGLGFSAIWKETAILAGMTVLLLVASLRSFKTRLA